MSESIVYGGLPSVELRDARTIKTEHQRVANLIKSFLDAGHAFETGKNPWDALRNTVPAKARWYTMVPEGDAARVALVRSAFREMTRRSVQQKSFRKRDLPFNGPAPAGNILVFWA